MARPLDPIAFIDERYPRLRIAEAPMPVRLPPGWLELVDDIARQIDGILPAEVAFTTVQLKEKTGEGRLRWLFDLDPVPDGVWERIMEIVVAGEQRSGETCAACGSPGGPVTVGRITGTLCPEHAAQYRNGRSLGALYAQGWTLLMGREVMRESMGALRKLKDR